jgi:hypothetical protein
MRSSDLPIYVIVAVVFLVLLAFNAWGQVGHSPYHEYYKNWKQPTTPWLSCCNARVYDDATGSHLHGDCAPTTARTRVGKDGLVHWFAKVPKEEYLYADEHGEIEIPDERVIHERNPSGQDAHLCFAYGKVLCFSPPDTGG